MNAHIFNFAGKVFHALPSGGLFCPAHGLLCVSDLHLGKSDRIARRTGTLIPPYENRATLDKLAQDIATTQPQSVICLGDSFDDMDAALALPEEDRDTLTSLQASRGWIWIEGNHDPEPIDLGGTHLASYMLDQIAFRHIATSQTPEISGHYHPKYGLPRMGRKKPCFIYDTKRLILPAYGVYTGGLEAQHPHMRTLFASPAIAVLTGKTAIALPLCAPKNY